MNLQTSLRYVVYAVYAVPLHVQWIKLSRRRIHKSFSAWVIVLLMINFSYCRYTCYTARNPSVVYIGLKDLPLPLIAKTVSISEATVTVHQFLSQTRKLLLKRGELSTSYQRQPSPKEQISLTTGQWLACLICIPIDLCHALCHHLTILAVICCCAMPVAHLLWRLCPSLGVNQLTSAPDQLVMAPLADAVCINYVYHMLLAPTVYKCHFLLAVVGINRMDPSTNWSVYPFMSIAILLDLFQRLPIRLSQHDHHEQHDREIRRQSCYRVYPSASLIAMLLVIGGIEINPGPIGNIVFIILMMMALPAKRPRTEPAGTRAMWCAIMMSMLLNHVQAHLTPCSIHAAEALLCTDGSPVAVHMSSNPLLDRLNANDLTQLSNSSQPLGDNVVTFLLGLLQAEAQQQQTKDWLFLNSFFFEKMYR